MSQRYPELESHAGSHAIPGGATHTGGVGGTLFAKLGSHTTAAVDTGGCDTCPIIR